jgi:hypothetical protein
MNELVTKLSKKTTDDMKTELKDKGIIVSGKSPKLLKDIYLYSLNNNIRIIKE